MTTQEFQDFKSQAAAKVASSNEFAIALSTYNQCKSIAGEPSLTQDEFNNLCLDIDDQFESVSDKGYPQVCDLICKKSQKLVGDALWFISFKSLEG